MAVMKVSEAKFSLTLSTIFICHLINIVCMSIVIIWVFVTVLGRLIKD